MKIRVFTYEQDALINAQEWEDGMNACLGGMDRNFNPHAEGSFEWKAWDLGWEETEEEWRKNGVAE